MDRFILGLCLSYMFVILMISFLYAIIEDNDDDNTPMF